MKNVIEIVNQIAATSSRNEKESILKLNKENELLKKVLLYTYDPFRKYKVTEKTIKCNSNTISFLTIFELLDILSANNINDKLRDEVNAFLSTVQDEEERDFYIKMLLKDLRCNISEKTINKVWDGLISTFDVMLAKSYKDFSHKVKGNFILTTKLDGTRCVAWREDRTVRVYTRQGKEIEGLIDIENDMLRLPNRMVFDGELIAENPNNLVSKDLFQVTRKLASKKGNKTGLEFHCFDMLPLEEFKKGKSKLGCYDRKLQLSKLLAEAVEINQIKLVPVLYHGDDKEMITQLHGWAKNNNLEGIMINLADAKYVCKRTDTLLKVKEFYTVDLKIIGTQEGTGKYENSLGALLVEYKGNTVGVGSGYTDSERDYLWNNRDSIIGRVSEVQFFEETVDEKTGLPSLRFPVYVQLRETGKEVSYN